ncbi:MAG: Peptidoglycan endopeptidase LytF precursor [Pelotomaculum sp. PtaU1.Bin035]|nr:MAG: Peptidoglycan endopeptidase LytF precursor [Pelotomaculum sp. PtaU1.Bin035]
MKKIFILLLVNIILLLYPAVAVRAEQPVLKQGMSGDDVLKLQSNLLKAGYFNGSLDGNFGSITQSAVLNFQADNRLAADGIAGPETLQVLQSLVSINTNTSQGGGNSAPGVLKQGMSGDNVLKLQTKLQAAGYYNGGIDGSFGPATRNAVINFQADCGIVIDGIAGPDTIQALQTFNPSVASVSRGAVGDRKAQAIVSLAKQFLGVPYVWAGSSPGGFDCSGFTSYVFSQFGIYLPHAADGQFNMGVARKQPGLGDLVFFSTYEPGPSHVGIYLGNDQFIHASSGGGGVCITSLSSSYYSARYLGARCVIN